MNNLVMLSIFEQNAGIDNPQLRRLLFDWLLGKTQTTETKLLIFSCWKNRLISLAKKLAKQFDFVGGC